MLRITGGGLRGRRLKAPAGEATRPTSDKVRQAIFNILAGQAQGARVCDLFAGSGALGLEALSRGARYCVFVEKRAQAARVIRENLAALDLTDQALVLVADACAPHPRLGRAGELDLILADPPYDQGLAARVLALAAGSGLLAPGGCLVLEHSPRETPPPPPGWDPPDTRAYGQTRVSFYRAAM